MLARRSAVLVSLFVSVVPMFAADAVVPAFQDPDRRAKLATAYPKIEEAFERFRTGRKVPGMSWGLIIDGELALVKAAGEADVDKHVAATPDTVFRIASMTKSFTALAILQLRDAGKVSLEDPVSKWIPQFARMAYPTRDTPVLRVRDLMTHSAGFPEDNPWGDRQLAISDAELDRWLDKGLPYSTPPQTAFEYSNYGFALLGRIVARASGMPYRTYVETRILAPLGMKSTTLEPSTVPAGVHAKGYSRHNDQYVEEPQLAHGAFGPMGGMLTTARDLAKYVAFMLSAWPPRDDQDKGPVRRSSVREMQKLWRTSGFSAERGDDGRLRAMSGGYGYGLSVTRDCRFAHIVGHGGGLPGFGSYMMWLPEYGVGFVAMANLTYSGPAGPMSEALDELLATGGLQPRTLPPSPALLSTRDAIVKLWTQWDDKALTSIATDNLFLDQAIDSRHRDVTSIQQKIGACRAPAALEAENLLRGSFRLPCERGSVDVYFTLAPTQPPKVQYLRFSEAMDLNAALRSAATALLDPTDEHLAVLAGAGFDAARYRRVFEPMQQAHGTCRLGSVIAGDEKQARVKLECSRGAAELRLRVDDNGKIMGATVARAPGAACGD